jgi:hypothetical protein
MYLNSRKEQLLGEAYFYLKEYQQARAHFWQGMNGVTSATVTAKIGDWIARCEYFERR